MTRAALHNHRVVEVRREAFATHLVYGFLRGREFAQIAPGSQPTVEVWARARRMLKKYGPSDAMFAFDAWSRSAYFEAEVA